MVRLRTIKTFIVYAYRHDNDILITYTHVHISMGMLEYTNRKIFSVGIIIFLTGFILGAVVIESKYNIDSVLLIIISFVMVITGGVLIPISAAIFKEKRIIQ